MAPKYSWVSASSIANEHHDAFPRFVAYADLVFAALERNGPTRKVAVRDRVFLLLE